MAWPKLESPLVRVVELITILEKLKKIFQKFLIILPYRFQYALPIQLFQLQILGDVAQALPSPARSVIFAKIIFKNFLKNLKNIFSTKIENLHFHAFVRAPFQIL